MIEGKISVIVPIYKGASYIDSIIKMLERNINEIGKNRQVELVIVNDYPDESISITNNYLQNLTVIIENHESNCGIHKSRVDGLSKSDGEYIFFLDQDDTISSNYIISQLEFLGDSDAVICNGKNLSKEIYLSEEEFNSVISLEHFLQGYNGIVSPGQVLIKRNSIPEFWKTNILKKNGADDYFLWMLMLINGCSFKFNKRILYRHNATENNTSNNSKDMDESVIEMVDLLYSAGFITNKDRSLIHNSRKPLTEKQMKLLLKKKNKESEILSLWKILDLRNLKISNFLKKNNIIRVTVYGMNTIGKLFISEVIKDGLYVDCILDRRGLPDYEGIRVYKPDDELFPARNSDLIVVTAFLDYKEIKEYLQTIYNNRIISLEILLKNLDSEIE